MSQPTSPVAGSPSPEAVLAQVLVQLQQGQAQIAKDTQEGLQKLSEGLQSAIKKPGVVDVKGIGKPYVLKGTHEMRFRSIGKVGAINWRLGFAVNGYMVRRRLTGHV